MQKIDPFHINEYGDDPEATVSVPGRFHLLGEHTWFAQGDTLSMAIDHYLYLAVSKRSDNNFRLLSLSLKERKKISGTNLKYRKEDRWANAVKAVILTFIEKEIPVTGLNFTIRSEIPADAGLGTPNALKVATALALRKLFAPHLTKPELADMLEYANTEHINTYAHRADILCVLYAKTGFCVHTEYHTKTVVLHRFPFEKHSVMLVDSRVSRLIAREDLGARFGECINAYELVCGSPDLPDNISRITERMLDEIEFPESVRRRVVFLLREFSAVRDAAHALENNDYTSFSRIITRSHEGLRDRFEISCPELDWLVKRAVEFTEPDNTDITCARMTGKGFGGCAYAILKNADMQAYEKKLNDYERIFGFKPKPYHVKPAGGARITH